MLRVGGRKRDARICLKAQAAIVDDMPYRASFIAASAPQFSSLGHDAMRGGRQEYYY